MHTGIKIFEIKVPFRCYAHYWKNTILLIPAETTKYKWIYLEFGFTNCGELVLRNKYLSPLDNNIQFNNADLFNQHIQTCINSISHYLMENLDKTVFDNFTKECSKIYQSRFAAIEDGFKYTPVKILKSEASFYTFLDFSNYFSSGSVCCDFLSQQLNIKAVPGYPYGDAFNNYIRICLTLPNNILSAQYQLIVKNLPNANI